MATGGGGDGGAALAAGAARVLSLAITCIVAWWVAKLGGVSAAPDADGKTGRLFNWVSAWRRYRRRSLQLLKL